MANSIGALYTVCDFYCVSCLGTGAGMKLELHCSPESAKHRALVKLLEKAGYKVEVVTSYNVLTALYNSRSYFGIDEIMFSFCPRVKLSVLDTVDDTADES